MLCRGAGQRRSARHGGHAGTGSAAPRRPNTARSKRKAWRCACQAMDPPPGVHQQVFRPMFTMDNTRVFQPNNNINDVIKFTAARLKLSVVCITAASRSNVASDCPCAINCQCSPTVEVQTYSYCSNLSGYRKTNHMLAVQISWTFNSPVSCLSSLVSRLSSLVFRL